ncbi:WhiB family transcriptional regulator [Bifidobacterium tibiigranuli]|jgi:hypothetical protein|uniref:WhiB family transcriptional regulator n=1 Tax=Bifidobacterium tibiigranuli TaxID=2172043 RepID=UPI002355D004|nr:WhiB family transcriptional regulator [Bifidobacterium tibiigranuli]MCH3973527.1 WhiB family transcriptional regulator [Bifidobacterium tibiigranuli]
MTSVQTQAPAGICMGLPQPVQDLMWGADSLPDARAQRELTAAAVKLCEMCPLQADCLALGIATHDQFGVMGGLPVRARQQLQRLAEEAGVRFAPGDPDPRGALARWLREHPEVVRQARDRENERSRARHRSSAERQRRWRAAHRAPDGGTARQTG